MKQIAFLEAPICAGSPTDGSQYAFDALRASLAELYGDDAVFYPMSPSNRRGMSCPPNLRSVEEVMDVSRRLYAKAMRAHAQGELPIVIGGDHSAAMGSMAASGETFGAHELSVVWIDGHTDIHTERSTESGCIHGMPLAQAMGICTDALNVGREKVHLLGQNTFIIGARSIDEGEYPILRAQGVHVITADQVREHGIGAVMSQVVHAIQTPYLHISFDVDCMDGEVFPATGYRMPMGMTKYEAFTALAALLRTEKTVSMDVVEYNPLLDQNGKSMRLLLELFEQISDYRKRTE